MEDFHFHSNDLFELNSIRIRGGSNDAYSTIAVRIKRILIHHQYNNVLRATHLQHDIAMVQLLDRIDVRTKKIDMISLPPYGRPLCSDKSNSHMTYVAGWGYTQRFVSEQEQELSKPPVALQVADVMIIPRKDCEKVYGNFSLTEHMICTNSTLTDVCQVFLDFLYG